MIGFNNLILSGNCALVTRKVEIRLLCSSSTSEFISGYIIGSPTSDRAQCLGERPSDKRSALTPARVEYSGQQRKFKIQLNQGTLSWVDTANSPNRVMLKNHQRISTKHIISHVALLNFPTYKCMCTKKQTWNAFHLFYHFGMQIYSCVHNLKGVIHLPRPALPNRVCVMSPTKNTFVRTC